MNTVYFTRDMWESRTMDHAVGETRQSGPCRPETAARTEGENKVIDLAAWKAENLVELDELDEPESGLGSYQGRELVRRRRKHESALIKGELAATLSVAGLMLALIVRVLVF